MSNLFNSSGKTLSVVESGSNTNGNYIKYDDGTMICYDGIGLGTISYSSTYGSLYTTSSYTNITFSQNFKSAPTMVCSSSVDGGVGGVAMIGNLTASGCKVWPSYPTQTSLKTSIYYIAIGKWK